VMLKKHREGVKMRYFDEMSPEMEKAYADNGIVRSVLENAMRNNMPYTKALEMLSEVLVVALGNSEESHRNTIKRYSQPMFIQGAYNE